MRDMIGYFYYTVTTQYDDCPGFVFAFTAALGSLVYIELCATLLFGGLLTLVGLLRPKKGMEGSNLMTLLKGAAMSTVDKKISELEEKVAGGKEVKSATHSSTAVAPVTADPVTADPLVGPCGHKNAPGAKFCEGCGSPLTIQAV